VPGQSEQTQYYVRYFLLVSPSLGNATLNICTRNVRALLGEDRLVELMAQVDNMNWDMIRLCETRMKINGKLARPE